MAFENDPEGYQMALGYAGKDFDKPGVVEHTTLNEYDGTWPLDEFLKMITDAVDEIPPQYRSTACGTTNRFAMPSAS